jgi:hypothetical protein
MIGTVWGGYRIRSRHGLTFLPRADLAGAAPELDRLMVPGAEVARRAAADGLELPEGLTRSISTSSPGSPSTPPW